MNKKIQKFVQILKNDNNLDFTKQCIRAFEEDEIIINSYSTNTVKKLIDAYTVRQKTQDKIIKTKTVYGYGVLLNELKKYDEELIVSTFVIANSENGFIFLYSQDDFQLISILKTMTVNLEKSKQLIEIYKKRGFAVNYCHYIKGVLIKCDGSIPPAPQRVIK